MPPKFKFTRDEITNAALNVTRKNGISGLTARAWMLCQTDFRTVQKYGGSRAGGFYSF